MAFKKRFQVSDESINDYGFWVRTAGIRLDNARKNCPAFYNHQTWDIPLGHWEDISLDATGKLNATLVIEGSNEREKQYITKIENGDIKGASIGADVLSWSEDVLYLKPGQTRPTVWESDLFEISLAPLPGNKNALALRKENSMINLSDGNATDFLPTLKTNDMKAIALKLGLKEDATEQQILEAIGRVQLSANNAETMRSHIEGLGSEQLENEDQKKLFVELTKTNFGLAVDFLKLHKKVPVETQPAATTTTDAATKTVKVTELIRKGADGKQDEGKETFDYLQRHNQVELARLRKEDRAKYDQLATDYKNGVRYKG